MKRFIILIIFLAGFTVIGHCQSDQTVTFVHGLGESSSAWNTMAGQLSNSFIFNPYHVYYNDAADISNSAANVDIPLNTVVVAHSEGGLLAREYLRQNGTGSVKALITVGTPNKGAPVAKALFDNKILQIVSGWIDNLLSGPRATLSLLPAQNIVKPILKVIGFSINAGEGPLYNYIKSKYNVPSAHQMIPGSSFMEQLNSSPGNTLPSARYAIYGVEKSVEYVRLANSLARRKHGHSPLNDGTYMTNYKNAISFYSFAAGLFGLIASIYRGAANYDINKYHYCLNHPFGLRCSFPLKYYRWYLHDSAKANYFRSIASAWFTGYYSLVYLQPFQWNVNIVGGKVFANKNSRKFYISTNDGFIPSYSQAPNYFNEGDNVQRILPALQTNHLEETVHPNVKRKLEQIFQKPDVNIPRNSGGGGDPPPPFPPPSGGSLNIWGPNNVAPGFAYTWKVVGASGTYDWWIKPAGAPGWIDTYVHTQTFSHAFSNSSQNPELAGVKVVASNGTIAKLITVSPQNCSNAATGDGGILNPHIIAPCPSIKSGKQHNLDSMSTVKLPKNKADRK